MYLISGFDPWNESAKALADLMEKEGECAQQTQQPMHTNHMGFMANGHTHQFADTRPRNLPPGFSPNHIGAYNGNMPPMGKSSLNTVTCLTCNSVVNFVIEESFGLLSEGHKVCLDADT